MDFLSIRSLIDNTIMDTFFTASKSDDAKRKEIIAAMLALDREAEAQLNPLVAKSWETLNNACKASPSATFNPFQIVGATSDSMNTLIQKTLPPPLTQMFIEAPLPTAEEILASVASPSGAEPSTANSVVKSFLVAFFAMPMGPVDEKILDCLTSITSSTLPEKNAFGAPGFEIVFAFDNKISKKYFRNPDLRLTVLFGEPSRLGPNQAAEKLHATNIDWIVNPTVHREELPPTVAAKKGTKRDRSGATPQQTERQVLEFKQPSFFHLFESFNVMENVDEQEKRAGEGVTVKEDDEEEEKQPDPTLQKRQFFILSRLVEFHAFVTLNPFAALKQLTPEEDEEELMMANLEDGEEGMGSDEEMDDEEDFDEDDDSDEEDSPQPPPKKKGPPQQQQKPQDKKGGKQPPAPAGGKGAPDCKQQ